MASFCLAFLGPQLLQSETKFPAQEFQVPRCCCQAQDTPLLLPEPKLTDFSWSSRCLLVPTTWLGGYLEPRPGDLRGNNAKRADGPMVLQSLVFPPTCLLLFTFQSSQKLIHTCARFCSSVQSERQGAEHSPYLTQKWHNPAAFEAQQYPYRLEIGKGLFIKVRVTQV